MWPFLHPKNDDGIWFEPDGLRRFCFVRLIRLHCAYRKYWYAMPGDYRGCDTLHEWRRLEPLYEDVEAPLTGEAASLVILYEQMLKNLAERKPPARVQAVTHLVSVEEKINEIDKLLGTVNFALFQSFYQQLASRYELVVYVLAMLEMARWGRAKIHQEEMNGPVWLYDINFDVDELPSNRLRAGAVRPVLAGEALTGSAPQAEEGLD